MRIVCYNMVVFGLISCCEGINPTAATVSTSVGSRFGLPPPTSSPLSATAVAVAFLRSFLRRSCTIGSSPTTSLFQFSIRRPCCNGLALPWSQPCNEPLRLEFRINIGTVLNQGLILFDIAVNR